MATSTPFPLPLHLLSLARMGVGTAAFIFPSLTAATFYYPQPSSSLLSMRLWGSRDAILGALLYTAKTPEARRRAVIAGFVVDALDVVAASWGFGKGEVEGMAAAGLGGGALSFLVLAAVGWRVGGLGALGKVAAKS